MEEIWTPIKNYEEDYEISNKGRVKSKAKHRPFGNGIRKWESKIMKLQTDKDGYKKISLSKNSKKKRFMVHRLVAEAFIPNPSSLPIVNHKNGVKDDNRTENLEWCTVSENTKHGFDALGRKGHNGGTNKRVVQIDIATNKALREFNSIADASRFVGCSAQNVSMCLNKKTNTAGGYKWDFVK